MGNAAFALYGLVRAIRPHVCVEIGSARGRSTCFIAQALKENGHGKLYAIDPHGKTDWNDIDSEQSLAILRANLSKLGLTEYVEIIQKRSFDAAADLNLQIDFLFIDGDYSYDGVTQDRLLFSRFVRPFGLVLFHDTLWDLKSDPQWSRSDMGADEIPSQSRFIFTRCGSGSHLSTSRRESKSHDLNSLLKPYRTREWALSKSLNPSSSLSLSAEGMR